MSRKKAAKLILGTVQFGLEYGISNTTGKPASNEVFSILDKARAGGIDLLDTAEGYGDAQELIGAYHHQSPNRFQIITKFSAKRTDLSPVLSQRVAQDLLTLGVNTLYCYMFHSFVDFERYYVNFKNDILQLKRSGVIQKLGVSIYTNNEFEALLKHRDVELIQLPFNLLDNNSKRGELIRKAKERGIEIHTRSVFLQGLFFKQPKNLPGKLSSLAPFIKTIKETSEAAKINITGLALNYAVKQNNIDRVLIGVDTVQQLRENLSALEQALDDATLTQIDQLNVGDSELLNPSNWHT